MLKDKPEDAKVWKERWDEKAKIFDHYESTFEYRLSMELEWVRLLKTYIPEDKNAKFLDAGGGTGRMTLPLAKLGYQVTLSDLSSGMLAVARERLQKEGLLERVEIKEANLVSLPFPDETFDLVICLHGAFSYPDSLKAAKELTRVMKRGAMIIVDALSRYWAAIQELGKDPNRALKLLKLETNYAYDFHGDWMRVFTPEELKELFEGKNARVIRICGDFYGLLANEVLERKEWDEKFLSQILEVMTLLREKESVLAMARRLILVGEKIGGCK